MNELTKALLAEYDARIEQAKQRRIEHKPAGKSKHTAIPPLHRCIAMATNMGRLSIGVGCYWISAAGHK